MTYQRLPYEDASTATEMASDCAQVGQTFQVPQPRADASGDPVRGARDDVVVTDDLAAMAAGLHLHLD